MRERHHGFTLFELIIAVAIIAMILTTAVPSLIPTLSAADVDAAAYSLASTLRIARVAAIHENRRTRVVIDLAASRFVSLMEKDALFTPQGPTGPLGRGVFVDRGRSTRIDNDQVSITFQSRGYTADNATVALATTGGAIRRVIVASSGRVRVQ